MGASSPFGVLATDRRLDKTAVVFNDGWHAKYMNDIGRDEGDCKGLDDGFVKIKWHSHFGDKIFYEVDLPDAPNIRFLHNGRVVAERGLSKFEISTIIDITKKINLQFLFKEHWPSAFLCPDLPRHISVRTKDCFLDFIWHASDEMDCPRQYKKINDLIAAVEKMIEVDFSDLLLPMYE